jgi:hypothetical protein
VTGRETVGDALPRFLDLGGHGNVQRWREVPSLGLCELGPALGLQ